MFERVVDQFCHGFRLVYRDREIIDRLQQNWIHIVRGSEVYQGLAAQEEGFNCNGFNNLPSCWDFILITVNLMLVTVVAQTWISLSPMTYLPKKMKTGIHSFPAKGMYYCIKHVSSITPHNVVWDSWRMATKKKMVLLDCSEPKVGYRLKLDLAAVAAVIAFKSSSLVMRSD